MKILVIDDSRDAQALVMARLKKEGYDLVCADGGAAGLEMALREQPDLILLDQDMPDLSGFDVCRKLKADPELRMIPVIFVSGAGAIDDKVMGLNLGAMDYVTKPFDAFELRARVNAALRTKRMQDLLINMAKIDPLTGLANRQGLMDRLAQEWSRFQRHGGRLAFIMADVDHFKKVNDTYGHAIGDRALQAVAAAIAGQVRKSDLVARYGGEEIAIVVPEESVEGAAQLAERCRQAVEAIRLTIGVQTLTATASFGVTDVSAADSPEMLIQFADQALYHAKSLGRNCVKVSYKKRIDERLTQATP